MTRADSLIITIPAFIDELVGRAGALQGDADFIRLAIALSRENVEQGGAPFGAVVAAGQRVVTAGVNRVLASGMSIAHAEIVTLMRTQTILQAGLQSSALTLYTSTEPCCQCYGAVVWSGITRLVCGASTTDAEAIGFDEGPKPPDWQAELQRRGITVTENICRDEAREVLELYNQKGGRIFGSAAPPANPSTG